LGTSLCTPPQPAVIPPLGRLQTGLCAALLLFSQAGQADPALDLPQLVSTDPELGAAVLHRADGQLIAARIDEAIAPGRWRLHAVAQDWIVVVPAKDGDNEVGTRARLYLSSANKAPLLIREQAPPAPLAPSLHLQVGKPVPAEKAKKP